MSSLSKLLTNSSLPLETDSTYEVVKNRINEWIENEMTDLSTVQLVCLILVIANINTILNMSVFNNNNLIIEFVCFIMFVEITVHDLVCFSMEEFFL